MGWIRYDGFIYESHFLKIKVELLYIGRFYGEFVVYRLKKYMNFYDIKKVLKINIKNIS